MAGKPPRYHRLHNCLYREKTSDGFLSASVLRYHNRCHNRTLLCRCLLSPTTRINNLCVLINFFSQAYSFFSLYAQRTLKIRISNSSSLIFLNNLAGFPVLMVGGSSPLRFGDCLLFALRADKDFSGFRLFITENFSQ